MFSTNGEFSHAKRLKADPEPQTFLPANSTRSEMAIIAWKCTANRELATRSDVIEFAEAVKREFKHVLRLT